MTDFLSHLAKQALGAESSIRPNLPPSFSFEPDIDSEELLPEKGNLEPPDGQVDSNRPLVARAILTPRPTLQAAREPASSETRPVEAHPERAYAQLPARATDDIQLRPEKTHAHSLGSGEGAPAHPAINPRMAPQPNIGEPETFSSPRTPQVAHLDEGKPVDLSEPLLHAEESSSQPGLVTPPALEQVLSEASQRQPLTGQLIPKPDGDGVKPIRRDHHAAEAGPAPIQVTIGRIEVKAVRPIPPKPAPQSAPQPARPRPAISLDAYLERRRRGGR